MRAIIRKREKNSIEICHRSVRGEIFARIKQRLVPLNDSVVVHEGNSRFLSERVRSDPSASRIRTTHVDLARADQAIDIVVPPCARYLRAWQNINQHHRGQVWNEIEWFNVRS